MTDEHLAPSVIDWLKDTDTPPRDTRASVLASVARAGEIRQARRRWPTRGLGWTVSYRAMAGMLAAFVLVAILGATAFLRPTAPDHDTSIAPGVSPPGGSILRHYSAWWVADSMVLRTSTGVLLDLGPLNAEMGDDPSDPSGRWTMEDGWPIDDPMLFVAFDSDGTDWWLDEVRIFGRDAGATYTADELDLRGTVGDWWYGGDVDIQLVADTRAGENQRATATLELEELRLAMLPPRRDSPQEGGPIAWILGQVGGLARAVAFWDRPPEETSDDQDAAPLLVTVPFGELTLTGELLDGGVVRVVDDGSGNNLQGVRDIAVGDDGMVRLARKRKILTLGKPGFVSVESGGRDGLGRIVRIEPGPDGSLDVYGATELKHLSGEIWSSLEAPPELMESALDGYWPKRMPDGSLWGTSLDGSHIGRRDGDTWTSWSLEELAQTLTPGLLETVSIELVGSPDGEVWAVSEVFGPDPTRSSLARYDGESWRPFDEVIAGHLAATEALWVRDLDIGPEGTVWVLVEAPGDGQELYWYAAEEWSSTPVATIQRMAEMQPVGARELYAGPAPGQVQLVPDNHHSLLFDGESALRLGQRPFRLRARSADGTLWGIGPQARDGLLMIPATEPTLVVVSD